MAKVRLGAVKYIDGNGFAKLALVVGTRKTIQKGTDVVRPDKGSANLLVISPQNPQKTYVRTNIPQGDGPRTWQPLDATADTNELDALVAA